MNPETPDDPSAMDRLRMDARVDARMLTADKPITESQRAALISELQTFKQTHGGKPLAWSTIAKWVGVSESVLSETVSGKYAGDAEKVLRRIDQFLAREEQQSKRPNIRDFQKTRLVEDMHTAVSQCILRRSIGVITGEPGDGKTFFARWLRDQNEGSILITCDPRDCDDRFIIDAIFTALKIGTYCRFAREKKREIESWLNSHTNTILIVDEAQHLTNAALEVLRSFHDKSDPDGKRNCPVVLFGDHNFYKVILGSRRGERSPLSPQITSRLFPVFNAEYHGAQNDDDGGGAAGDVVFTRDDIERIVKQNRLRLVKPEALAFAVKLANLRGWGRLRLASRVLEIAMDLKRGPQVSLDDMRNALGLFIGPSEGRLILSRIESEAPTHRRAAAGGA